MPEAIVHIEREAKNRLFGYHLPRAELRILLAILTMGLLVRLILLWSFSNVGLKVHDENDYNRLAVILLEHGEYAFTPGTPTSLRPPLYPALVAVVYAVFGSENYQAVRAVQIPLSLSTVIVVYVLGKQLYGVNVGLLAATTCCFYPSLLGANNLVLTETLFTLQVCLFILAFGKYFSSGQRRWLSAAGVLLGLGALTRSVLWLFPPFAVIAILLYGRELMVRDRLLSAALLVAAFCVTLAPWTIRNTSLQQTFTTVDVMGGRNVMMGNYEFTPEYRPWAAIEINGEESWHRVLSNHHNGLEGKTQGQIDKMAMRYGIEYVLVHPGMSVKRSILKMFHFWQLERELIAGMRQNLWGALSPPIFAALSMTILTFYVLVVLWGIYGATMIPPSNRGVHILILMLILFVTTIHAIAFGHSRYHLPLMPLMMVYASAGWLYRRDWLLQWRSWSFGVATGLALILIASWMIDLAFEAGRIQAG